MKKATKSIRRKLNGGAPGAAVIDGGITAIDPDRLVRDPFNGCNPVYPWNFVRTNTIYGVIHKAGGYTAWSDKHAVYAVVSGPTGTSIPSNVDDYYSPEVNSNQIPLPGLTTAGTKFDCCTHCRQCRTTGRPISMPSNAMTN